MTKISTALFLCVCISILASQPKLLKATRTATPPVIDGYGNDEMWKLANTATDFVQREPIEGTPESERTEFKILYDDHNLYVYAMMYDSHPDSIVSRLARRDDIPESDWFGIGFDSYNDKQTAFIFIVLPSGSKSDELMYNDGRDENYSWDPVWEVETTMLPDGWSAEFKIPLSQIRFTEGNDTWGMNVARRISRKQEETNWNLMSKKKDGFVSQFGIMTGMADIQLTKLFEVLPYAVGASEHYPQTKIRERVERINPSAGVDIKYGITSNFTLDATINPDFAQVEADPAVLNLTTFETFYPEKRPFFIEGTQILRFTTFGGSFGPGLFYSRRIGKPVRVGLPPDGKIITEEPFHSTILTAAKLTGKTEGGVSIGLLTAVMDEEEFSYRDTLNNIKTLRAEPHASYNLFRVKQDFWGNSNIGFIATGVARENRFPAYTAGTDWNVKFMENNYQLDGFLASSRIVRSDNEIREGSAGKIHFGKVSGDWVWGLSSDFTSKKYYINDMGFFNAPNDYGMFGNLTHRDFEPGEYFRSVSYGFSPHLRWTFDGLTLFKEMNAQVWGQFLNYWDFDVSASYSTSAKDPFESRGNGAFNVPQVYFVRGEIGTDSRKEVVFEIEENIRMAENGYTKYNTESAITFKPSSSVEFGLSGGYALERRRPSYVDEISDSVTTFAVFGKRDVDNLDVTIRSSVLFSNELSLQFYNQFYWAKGTYHNFSRLQTNGNLISYTSYTGNPDFNETSLQTNIVLRWEYREGSTFFFVWSHGRAFEQNGGYNTSLGTNLENTFLRTSPDNVYVVKVSYWISL